MDQTNIKPQTSLIEENTNLYVDFDKKTLESWETWVKVYTNLVESLKQYPRKTVISKNINIRNELNKYVPSKYVNIVLIWWTRIAGVCHTCTGSSFCWAARELTPHKVKFKDELLNLFCLSYNLFIVDCEMSDEVMNESQLKFHNTRKFNPQTVKWQDTDVSIISPYTPEKCEVKFLDTDGYQLFTSIEGMKLTEKLERIPSGTLSSLQNIWNNVDFNLINLRDTADAVISKESLLGKALKRYIPGKHVDSVLIRWNYIAEISRTCREYSHTINSKSVVPSGVTFRHELLNLFCRHYDLYIVNMKGSDRIMNETQLKCLGFNIYAGVRPKIQKYRDVDLGVIYPFTPG